MTRVFCVQEHAKRTAEKDASAWGGVERLTSRQCESINPWWKTWAKSACRRVSTREEKKVHLHFVPTTCCMHDEILAISDVRNARVAKRKVAADETRSLGATRHSQSRSLAACPETSDGHVPVALHSTKDHLNHRLFVRHRFGCCDRAAVLRVEGVRRVSSIERCRSYENRVWLGVGFD